MERILSVVGWNDDGDTHTSPRAKALGAIRIARAKRTRDATGGNSLAWLHSIRTDAGSAQKLPHPADQPVAEETRGHAHPVAVEGPRDLAIALNDPSDRVGSAARPHANEGPGNVPHADPVLLDEAEHQLEVACDPIGGVESSERPVQGRPAEERRMRRRPPPPERTRPIGPRPPIADDPIGVATSHVDEVSVYAVRVARSHRGSAKVRPIPPRQQLQAIGKTGAARIVTSQQNVGEPVGSTSEIQEPVRGIVSHLWSKQYFNSIDLHPPIKVCITPGRPINGRDLVVLEDTEHSSSLLRGDNRCTYSSHGYSSMAASSSTYRMHAFSRLYFSRMARCPFIPIV